MLVTTYKTVWCLNPEDQSHCLHGSENLKSYTWSLFILRNNFSTFNNLIACDW
jgi:hypothetical protein